MSYDDQRRLGASGLAVPALGVGIWSWGDAQARGYGKTHTREDVAQAYRTCLDAGLNFFDTAEIYGSGESERLLGAFHQEDGRPIRIATKFAPRLNPLARTSSSPRSLLDALERSLERLGIESVDLYQIHWPSPLLKVEALMDVMAEAVEAGKVRAVGVSNYSATLLRRAHAALANHGIPLASNQVQYSLLHRHPESNGVLAACRELNVALIAYTPLDNGLLTGKYRTGPRERPPATFMPALEFIFSRLDPFGEATGMLRVPQRLLHGTARDIRRATLEPLFLVLDEIAHTHNKTIAQVALNWLLSADPCVIPIPGAKNARQASENAGALGWRLSEEEHARLSASEVATRFR